MSATANPALPTQVRADRTVSRLLPGLACTVLIAAVATAAACGVPLIGAPVIGLVIGVLFSPTLRTHTRMQPGVRFAANRVLQVAVVVLGSQLSLRQVIDVGAGSLPVMLGTLAVCLLLGETLGRRLAIGPDLRTLIGVGTGICGASAIAAISPVLRAKGSDVAYAVSTIFLFNMVAVLSFPAIGHLLGLSQQAFGLFAGTAVNDTSSVVAAAASYGNAATHHAVVVKLTRTLMIVPIAIGLAAIDRRRGTAGPADHVPIRRLVPWFLVAFLLVAAASSAGAIPHAADAALQTASVFLITVALAGIGLSTDLSRLRGTGPRPLLLGLGLWISVAATSLLL
jgi:uncharacterized integral membrane protein (TIGR00698 family)